MLLFSLKCGWNLRVHEMLPSSLDWRCLKRYVPGGSVIFYSVNLNSHVNITLTCYIFDKSIHTDTHTCTHARTDANAHTQSSTHQCHIIDQHAACKLDHSAWDCWHWLSCDICKVRHPTCLHNNYTKAKTASVLLSQRHKWSSYHTVS